MSDGYYVCALTGDSAFIADNKRYNFFSFKEKFGREFTCLFMKNKIIVQYKEWAKIRSLPVND